MEPGPSLRNEKTKISNSIPNVRLMRITGSYLGANLVLYLLAVSCFGFYFVFSNTNPITEIKASIKYLINKFR